MLTKADKTRERFYKTAFNLTLLDWSKILDYQEGKCFICQKRIDQFKDDPSVSRPHTDHNHKTGAVRGLLCSQCNRALGKAEDPRWQWNAECFTRAGIYLRFYPATAALGRVIIGYAGKIGTKKYRKWAVNKNQMELFDKK